MQVSTVSFEKNLSDQIGKGNLVKDPLYFVLSILKNSQKLIPLYFDEKKWKQLENEGIYKFFTAIFSKYIFGEPDHTLKLPRIDHTLNIPDPVLKQIFSFLTPKELARICTTCKRWNQLVADPNLWDLFDLEKLFPKSVFLTESWEKYFGVKVEMPKYDKRPIIAELYRSCPFIIGKDTHETHILVLMPEGLTIESLKKYAEGRCKLDESFWNPTIELKNKPRVSKTCLKLITKMIIPETRGKPILENKAVHFENFYEIPDLLTAVVANLFRQKIKDNVPFKYTVGDFKKGKQNFLIKLWNMFNNLLSEAGLDTRDYEILWLYHIFTICKEEIERTPSKKIFVVGGMSPDNLDIFHIFDDGTHYEYKTGIAPMKQLSFNLIS